MSEPVEESVQEATRWLCYARDDLTAAEVLAHDDSVLPRQACWLAQPKRVELQNGALGAFFVFVNGVGIRRWEGRCNKYDKLVATRGCRP